MSIKVLVADDSITIQKVIGIIFGGDEYSLTVVDNGKAAFDKAREINPDILLIDALMPGMTGYEVSEMIRSTPSLAAMPILILTGSFEPFDEEKAKKCGADDFIAKPFESQQIISKVKELLELGSSRTRTAQTSQPQPVTETVRAEVPEVSAPIFDIPAPFIDQRPEARQPAAPEDIWGAFTPEVDQTIETVSAPVVTAPSAVVVEPDVFAIVSEESYVGIAQTAMSAAISPDHTGTQWVPVEENTFEFEEETIAESHRTAFEEQTVPVQEAAFGDITFEETAETPSAPAFSVPEPSFTAPVFTAPVFTAPAFTAPSPEPAFTAAVVTAPAFTDFTVPSPTFEEPPVLEPVPIAKVVTPAVTPPSVTLTEEQLKAAITAASKDVIERIVWEIVPDLAEVLIRDAIRKIKEGA